MIDRHSLEGLRLALRVHGPCQVFGYKWRLIALSCGTVESSEWHRKPLFHKDEQPILENETTYDKCVGGRLHLIDDAPTLELEIWNGDNLDGRPLDLRATFDVVLTSYDPKILELKHAVDRMIETSIQDEIDRLEEIRLNRLRDKAKKSLFPEFF